MALRRNKKAEGKRRSELDDEVERGKVGGKRKTNELW